jgi:acyl-CoA synthetase (AMP-forming)/AMP-acid ligase II
MIQFATLPEMLDQRARGDGAIGYLEGDGVEKSLKLAELRRRALGILRHLQTAGARPGDRLILHVASNEQFIDAYWACLYGGIVPVPVAVGISDAGHKLLRIARQLGSPPFYTDRSQDRLAPMARLASVRWRAPERRTFWMINSTTSSAGSPRVPATMLRSSSSHRARRAIPRASC